MCSSLYHKLLIPNLLLPEVRCQLSRHPQSFPAASILTKSITSFLHLFFVWASEPTHPLHRRSTSLEFFIHASDGFAASNNRKPIAELWCHLSIFPPHSHRVAPPACYMNNDHHFVPPPRSLPHSDHRPISRNASKCTGQDQLHGTNTPIRSADIRAIDGSIAAWTRIMGRVQARSGGSDPTCQNAIVCVPPHILMLRTLDFSRLPDRGWMKIAFAPP